MRLSVLIAAGFALGLGALAAPAPAAAGGPYDNVRVQAHGYVNPGYGRQAPRRDQWRSGWNVRAQMDRPGDYRCDAFWDANRTDCGARWRDQRHRAGYAARNAGYGYRQVYGQASYGYSTRGYPRRGYGRATYAEPNVYHGAYGRPDLVYPGAGGRYGHADRGGARDPYRVNWCLSRYRSYDPNSGYYRAYSGRLIYCG